MSGPALARDVEQAMNVTVERSDALEGGEFNDILLLTTDVGQLVVRRPRFAQSWRSSLWGQAAAIDLCRSVDVPVPEVVHVDDDLIVHRFVPGHAMTDEDAAGGLAAKAGELLARVHAITGDGLGPVQADGTSPGWPDTTHFNEVTAEVGRLLASFDEAWGIRRADIERAGELLASPPSLRSCLVHGDIGTGNIVVDDDGEIAAIIDFDSTWFGDPAVDLAWWWWRSPQTVDAFEAGGIANGDRTEPLPLWACRVRLLVGLADVFASRMPDRANYIGELLAIAVPQLARYSSA